MALKSLILAPIVVDPPDTIFFCVAVPDDPNHVAAFLGQMLWLTKWYAWQQTETVTGKMAADVWKPIYECILEQVP